jgi:hypothetical protein
MDLNSFCQPDPIATLLGQVFGAIVMIGLVAVPLGWIFAGIATWRPLPHLFAILALWFGGLHGTMSAVMLLVVAISLEGGYGVEGGSLGFLAATTSGMFAWIVVGRRSRDEELMPSLL